MAGSQAAQQVDRGELNFVLGGWLHNTTPTVVIAGVSAVLIIILVVYLILNESYKRQKKKVYVSQLGRIPPKPIDIDRANKSQKNEKQTITVGLDDSAQRHDSIGTQAINIGQVIRISFHEQKTNVSCTVINKTSNEIQLKLPDNSTLPPKEAPVEAQFALGSVYCGFSSNVSRSLVENGAGVFSIRHSNELRVLWLRRHTRTLVRLNATLNIFQPANKQNLDDISASKSGELPAKIIDLSLGGAGIAVVDKEQKTQVGDLIEFVLDLQGNSYEMMGTIVGRTLRGDKGLTILHTEFTGVDDTTLSALKTVVESNHNGDEV